MKWLLVILAMVQFAPLYANECERRGFGSQNADHSMPLPPRDPKLDKRDFAGTIAEAIATNPHYAPLAWPEHDAKRRFLVETFLPHVGWRGILARPGDLRPITVNGNRLVLKAYGGSAAMTFSWDSDIQEPRWSVAGDTGFHSFTLRIPTDFSFANFAEREQFFDTGMVGHDLQRYTAPLEIQRIRQVLGEPRFILKPGQQNILQKFAKALDAQGDSEVTRFLVLGPSAYGKTFLLINAMKERISRRLKKEQNDPAYRRNLFIVVTRKRNIAAQIADEVFYNQVLSQSQALDFEHWGLHDDEQRLKNLGSQDLIEKANEARDRKKALIVTIDWSYLSKLVATADATKSKELQQILNGIFIDEADQTHLDSNIQTINTLTENNRGVVLWGQDAMSFHHEVRDVVFRGQVYRIFADELDATETDAATLTVQQTRLATASGEIAPIVDFKNNHVITHYFPGDVLEPLISAKREVPYNALFQPIEDQQLRQEVYGNLALHITPLLTRHKGFIRVNTTEQADQLAEFLQAYSNEHRLGLTIASFHSKTRQADNVYSRWRDYHTSEHPIDWLISVRLLDESVDAPHISGVLLLTDDIDEETFLKIYGRPTRHFPGKRFAEIWQISHKPVVDQKIIEGLQRKELEVNAIEEPKTPQGMVLGGSRRLEDASLTFQHLLPIFPTDVRDLDHLKERIKDLNESLVLLGFLLSNDLMSQLLTPYVNADVRIQRRIVMNLNLIRWRILEKVTKSLNTHLGPHAFYFDRQYLEDSPLFDDVSVYKNPEVQDSVSVYLDALRKNNQKVSNILTQKSALDFDALLRKSQNLPSDFIEYYRNDDDLFEVLRNSYEINPEANSSTLKLLSQSTELRNRLGSLWPITKTEAFTRLRRLKMAGLWRETLTIDNAEQQFMNALLDFVVTFEESKGRLVRLQLAVAHGNPGKTQIEEELQKLLTLQRNLLETVVILIPSDPILVNMLQSLQQRLPSSANLKEIQNFQIMAIGQVLVHLDTVYGNLFPKGFMTSDAFSVLLVHIKAKFSPLEVISSLNDFRKTLTLEEKSWLEDPKLNRLRDLQNRVVAYHKENPGIFVGMLLPQRDDPLYFKKLYQKINERILLIRDLLALKGDIVAKRDEFAVYSRQHIQDIFLGHEGEARNRDMAKTIKSTGMRYITAINLSGTLLYNPQLVTENSSDLRSLLMRLANSYEKWMDPSSEPVKNIWNLDLDRFDHETQQQTIVKEFNSQYRAWLNDPNRMQLGQIFNDEKKIPMQHEEVLHWFYMFSWRATQFVLIQKSLDPQHRLMPIESFIQYQQALVEKAVEAVNQFTQNQNATALLAFEVGVPNQAAFSQIEATYRVAKPLDELYVSGLVTLRKEIIRNIGDLKDTHKAYGSLQQPAIWEAYQSAALKAYGLDRWITPTNTTKTREYFAVHLEKLLRLLYQVDQQLHQADPRKYAKPKKPK